MEISRHTTSQGRTYKVGDKSYPSVTTVLRYTKNSKALDDWRKKVGNSVADFIMNNAATIGSQTHEMIEDYLNGKDPYVPLKSMLSQAHFENLKKYLKNITDIRGIEMQMYSEEFKIAGTADCIAKYKGMLSIIDYKTKRKAQREEWLDDYFVQAAAYAEMYEEKTGELPEKLVVLVSSEDNMSQEVIRYYDEYIDKLAERVRNYNLNNGKIKVY